MLGLCEYRLGAFAPALAHVQRGRRLGVSADPQFRLVMRYHEGLLLVHAAEFERAQETLDELSAEGVDTEDLGPRAGARGAADAARRSCRPAPRRSARS